MKHCKYIEVFMWLKFIRYGYTETLVKMFACLYELFGITRLSTVANNLDKIGLYGMAIFYGLQGENEKY